MSGFNITYSMSLCPMDCSNHGRCEARVRQGDSIGGGDHEDYICVCDFGWHGAGCEMESCPNSCNHGMCTTDHTTNYPKCQCNPGYRGIDCSSTSTHGIWTIEEQIGDKPAGRASHQTVLQHHGGTNHGLAYMWVVSGSHLGNQVFHQLARYDFSSQSWDFPLAQNAVFPLPRYGHTAVLYEDKIYMFGGMVENNVKAELWEYSTVTSKWRIIDNNDTRQMYPDSEVKAVVGHTAHVIDGVMYVIFGHSPVYGYMNMIQECDMRTFEWTTRTDTTGAIVKGGYGHSSVYDSDRGVILIHAGYHSTAQGSYELTSTLYQYNPRDRHWRILRSSPQQRYLHSAAIIGDLMLIFGGNTHNDTSMSHGAKCYSLNFLAYDIECDTWHTLDSSELHEAVARFGHSAQVYNEEMYIFGGFTGIMRNDIYKYTPAACPSFDEKAACLATRQGTKCVWVESQGCFSKQVAVQLVDDKRSSGSYQQAECPHKDANKDVSMCLSLKSCASCLETTYQCKWCRNRCTVEPCDEENIKINNYSQCTDDRAKVCNNINNCVACHQYTNCTWPAAVSRANKDKSCDAMHTAVEYLGVLGVAKSLDATNTSPPPTTIATTTHAATLMSSSLFPQPNYSRAGDNIGDDSTGASASNPPSSSALATDQHPVYGNPTHSEGGNNVRDGTLEDGGDSSATTSATSPSSCSPPCHIHHTCNNCTQAACMWCSSRNMCVESNSYVASFPYGQCMEWTTENSKCTGTRCSHHQTCQRALESPACGWCDDGSNTGLGKSMEGRYLGPVRWDPATRSYTVDYNLCPSQQWHFADCPDCQCNGHSTCLNTTVDLHSNSSKLGSPAPGYSLPAGSSIISNVGVCEACQNHTTGDHCERCMDSYYGSPVNGGNCTRCECNGKADTCDSETGVCFCQAKGVTGTMCDTCEDKYSYIDNQGGHCFYSLMTDYQFTFNLSKEADKHYAQINFLNMPHTDDRDVDFKINCSGFALMNLTVTTSSQPEERMLISERECQNFQYKFSHKEYEFGITDNTTFFVYLYDFKTPFWLQVSFVQRTNITLDVSKFLTVFCSCFLALLLIAAVFWKVKQKYDMYRQRQRMVVQMEQMASRPFATVPIEVENIQLLHHQSTGGIGKHHHNPSDTHSLPRKKKHHAHTTPTPIALEPVEGYKAAVITLLIKLPRGDEDYAPQGTSGFMIGSSLVTMGTLTSRKQSTDPAREKLRSKKLPPPQCV